MNSNGSEYTLTMGNSTKQFESMKMLINNHK